MTFVKPQISKFQADTHERLLSDSSRPYMLAYYLSAFIDCAYFLVVCLEEKTLFKL
jgi:hypothetical protein